MQTAQALKSAAITLPAYPVELLLLIDGEWLGAAGRAVHRLVNPATGDTLGELPLATASDLDLALDAAARGFRLWRARPSRRGRTARLSARIHHSAA